MRLRAELRCPLDVFAGLGVKGTGQSLVLRQHVARPSLSPLRLGRSRHAAIFSSQKQAGTKQQAPNSKPPAATPAAAGAVEQEPPKVKPDAFHWQQLDRELQQAPINKESLRQSPTYVVPFHEAAQPSNRSLPWES